MPVFFVSSECITPPTLSVTGNLVVHLRDSLRVIPGNTLIFSDGQGARYRVALTEVSQRAIIGDIVEMIREPPRCRPQLILGQSLLKGDKMDWVLQKATELGVSQIIPIESRHSVVQLRADRVTHQLSRWQRITLEAAQQSEQWRVPALAPPASLKSLLSNYGSSTVTMMLAERQDGTSLQVVTLPKDSTSSILLLIGPEGGWSREEVEVADQLGIVPNTLGQQILRAETAAIAAISILQSRLGHLG